MKINPLGEPNPKEVGDRSLRAPVTAGSTLATGPVASAASSQAVDALAAAEKVELSEASIALSQLSSEPFDAAKVAEIRKAISEGRFDVNAERVADRMINDAAELIVRIFGAGSKAQQ